MSINNPNFPNPPDMPEITKNVDQDPDNDDEVPPDEDEEDEDAGMIPPLVPNPFINPPGFLNQLDVKKKSKSIKLNLDNITTEGLSLQDLDGADYTSVKENIKGCNYCGKYYKLDMCIPTFEKDDDVSCWHCFFWMNYSLAIRKNADGVYGMTIVDYILKCSAIHETDKCQRNTDSGGCFLCEYNLGLPVTDIKDLHRLGSATGASAASFGIPDKPHDDDDRIAMDPSSKTEQITVFI